MKWSGNAGLYDKGVYNIINICQTLFQGDCTILHSPNTVESSSSSSFLLEFDLVILCNFSHLVGMSWYFTVVLISFPVMNGIAHTLHTHNLYVKFLTSSTSEYDCVWWWTFKVITEVIWAQIQSHWCPCKKRKFGNIKRYQVQRGHTDGQ